MREQFVRVFSHLQIYPIELAKSVLEDSGILTMVKGYDETRPHLSYGTSIELQVPESEKEKAEELIKEIQEEFK